MNNPRVVNPLVAGAAYEIPTFKVSDEGIEDGAGMTINFCKGNKQDPSALRQEGVFSETLIEVSKRYLEAVNVGDLASRETSLAITKLEEALMWLNKRALDRQIRGVQSTYQK